MSRGSPLLEFRGLWKRFRNGSLGLAGVELEIGADELLVLSGPNGSGKTLLMRHAIGLETPSSGEVRYRGKPVLDYGPSIHAKVGYVFQSAEEQSLGDTVRDDISIGPRNLGRSEAEVAAAVERAVGLCGLRGFEERMVFSLSGGEGRRLAVAAIAAMEPELMILDEPFANLDYPGVRSVIGVVERLREHGAAVVVVTHELEKVAALADRLVVMDRGKVALEGKIAPDTLEAAEAFGIRNPLRPARDVSELVWR